MPYPIPDDVPAGKLVYKLERHPFRPMHTHVIVEAEGFDTVGTHIFDDGDPYLASDVVIEVKESLNVDFKPVSGGDTKGEQTSISFSKLPLGLIRNGVN